MDVMVVVLVPVVVVVAMLVWGFFDMRNPEVEDDDVAALTPPSPSRSPDRRPNPEEAQARALGDLAHEVLALADAAEKSGTLVDGLLTVQDRQMDRMDRLEERMVRAVEGFAATQREWATQFDQEHRRGTRLGKRVDALEVRMGEVVTRMDRMEERLGRVEERLGRVEDRVERLDQKVDLLSAQVGDILNVNTRILALIEGRREAA